MDPLGGQVHFRRWKVDGFRSSAWQDKVAQKWRWLSREKEDLRRLRKESLPLGRRIKDTGSSFLSATATLKVTNRIHQKRPTNFRLLNSLSMKRSQKIKWLSGESINLKFSRGINFLKVNLPELIKPLWFDSSHATASHFFSRQFEKSFKI